jgi:hypothetical protein
MVMMMKMIIVKRVIRVMSIRRIITNKVLMMIVERWMMIAVCWRMSIDCIVILYVK